jgi:hypothetical protein
MNSNTFQQQALAALDSVFAFADFTKRSESFFDEASDDSGFVRQYKIAWFELEIINSVALEDWESDGRPRSWNEKWNEKYKREAADAIRLLLEAVEGR